MHNKGRGERVPPKRSKRQLPLHAASLAWLGCTRGLLPALHLALLRKQPLGSAAAVLSVELNCGAECA